MGAGFHSAEGEGRGERGEGGGEREEGRGERGVGRGERGWAKEGKREGDKQLVTLRE